MQPPLPVLLSHLEFRRSQIVSQRDNEIGSGGCSYSTLDAHELQLVTSILELLEFRRKYPDAGLFDFQELMNQ